LDAFPAATREGVRVSGNSDGGAADSDEVFKVRQLVPKCNAISKGFLNPVLADVFLGTEERMYDIIFREFVSEKFANVSGKKIGKSLQFEPRDGPFSLLDLYDDRPGDAELFCDLILRHSTRLACLSNPAAQLDLINGHVSP
jgi:hypothetical protein